MTKEDKVVGNISDSWESLKHFTEARIALGRAGDSIPIQETLAFKLAHAHARDAVHSVLAVDTLKEELKLIDLPVLELHSQALNRQVYLQRPDLGRLLNDASTALIQSQLIASDICITLADGLSATAINRNAVMLLQSLLPLLKGAGFQLAPICLVEQGRVAIADPIAYGLQSRLSLILIGERPGLSAADSLGVYMTYQPHPGLTDESRNCISNIRAGGLSFPLAAQKIFYLVQEAFRRKLSGVELKDNEGLLGAV